MPVAVVVSVFPLTDAPVVPALFIDQAMVLFVALDGATVPFNVKFPTPVDVDIPVISVTATKVLPPPPELPASFDL